MSLEIVGVQEPRFRVWDELYAKAFASLGLRLAIRKVHQSENTLLEQTAKYQMSFSAWNIDYPDAEDFHVILYGPAAGFSNATHFKLPN